MGMLYWNTVNPLLTASLKILMNQTIFNSFRLVGGTALSLQLGNRVSVDIDLFTDAPYGSIDFGRIEMVLNKFYTYVDSGIQSPVAMGKSYRVGESKNETIKLDIYYTDSFIHEPKIIDGIRMATIEEILAMKIDVVQRKGRKKDFWDICELLENFSMEDMLLLHEKRYPYSHDKTAIIKNMTDFDRADYDPDPICLKGRHWELVKFDIVEFMDNYRMQ